MAATAPILVAFATANTGSKVVEQLSAAGHVVRALVRNPDKPEAKALAALPHVEVVKGDIDSGEGIKEALTGVKRAFLTTGAGDTRDWRNVSAWASARPCKEDSAGHLRTQAGIRVCRLVMHHVHACITAAAEHGAPL